MLWLILCIRAFQLTVAVNPKDRDALVEELSNTRCLDTKPTDCTINQWDVSKVTDMNAGK